MRVTHVLKPCSGVATALAGEKLTFAKRRRQASHLDLAQGLATGGFHNSRHCKGQGAATLKLNTNTSLHVLSGDMYFSLDKRLYLSSRIQPLKGKLLAAPCSTHPAVKEIPLLSSLVVIKITRFMSQSLSQGRLRLCPVGHRGNVEFLRALTLE